VNIFSFGQVDQPGATNVPSSMNHTLDLHSPKNVVCLTRNVFSFRTSMVAGLDNEQTLVHVFPNAGVSSV
jgi:hypothetical protein